MRTWRFPVMRPPGDGPWSDEPDKAQWVDPTTDLDCLAVRNDGGAWCGYVGLPPEHPLYGTDFHALPADITAHGDRLNYSDFCAEIDSAEDGPYICHVPEPGRPVKVWWLGFHCAGAWDVSPTRDAQLAELIPDFPPMPTDYPRVTYKPFSYVQAEVTCLAVQLRRQERAVSS